MQPLSGENFLYLFQGRARRARRAARLAARNRVRDTAGELAHTAEGGRDAPAGNPPHQAAAARLTAVAHGGWRPRHGPQAATAPAERRNPPRVRERGHPPARSLLKPSKITVKAVCDRRPTGHRRHDQVPVHAKTTLTVIFHRFAPAPVGRMARSDAGTIRASPEPRKSRDSGRGDSPPCPPHRRPGASWSSHPGPFGQGAADHFASCRRLG